MASKNSMQRWSTTIALRRSRPTTSPMAGAAAICATAMSPGRRERALSTFGHHRLTRRALITAGLGLGAAVRARRGAAGKAIEECGGVSGHAQRHVQLRRLHALRQAVQL